MVNEQTIARLSVYRRALRALRDEGCARISSQQLAQHVNGAATRVRRDIMALGCSGAPNKGYDVAELLAGIDAVLDAPVMQNAALIGVGHLGQALLSHFSGRWRRLGIKVAFDSDPRKVGAVMGGCKVFSIDALVPACHEYGIVIGILTTPPEATREIAAELCDIGVRGLLNFSPVRLQTPPSVYVEDIDVSMALEKVAYYAREPGIGAPLSTG